MKFVITFSILILMLLYTFIPIKINVMKLSQKTTTFKKKISSGYVYFNNLEKKSTQINCGSSEFELILGAMPEAFLNDEKRPEFFTLPVLQRIGRLDILRKKSGNRPPKKVIFNELDQEFLFLSLKKTPIQFEISLFVTLGLNKEDNLLKMGQLKVKDIANEVNSNIIQSKILGKENVVFTFSQITFSIVKVEKSEYASKILFSLLLFTISYFSLI